MPEDLERAKTVAARYAVEHHVQPGLRIALGTGSTAAQAVRAIAEQFPGGKFDCVASSSATEELARELHIPVRPLRGDDHFDLMLDGADEVSPALDMTKGGGGALLREKLLAGRSASVVILVDPSKLVGALGERASIPVEVVPFARPVLERELVDDGYRVRLRVGPDGRPFVTDNGNEILDLSPREPIRAPSAAAEAIRRHTGVVEVGIFSGLASLVVVGFPDGRVEEKRPTRARRR
ncbi:MAG TPA: ribose-5-phosphate isomerase RpiA [Thermoplasmata archaeon]|nr:ribose-5-phosphate isomerase RpiA [Thermoplasmata archaeon]